ncbi:hypothetical protein BDR04DRAFT_1102145 [Suillus decipiens]|nr:hypothetical protein BDR04DRAFT_1102145 [Suillus decipiens]
MSTRPGQLTQGLLKNLKYDEPLKVNGSDQWIIKFNEETQVALMSTETGTYLKWDARQEFVVMSTTECWWNTQLLPQDDALVLALQVPPGINQDEGLQTLQMQPDHSVILQNQVGNPNETQLWMVVTSDMLSAQINVNFASAQ